MAITTAAGNTVKFLGLNADLRIVLLKALLGYNDGTAKVNTSKKCYVGLSSTNPELGKVSEPSVEDANYRRIKIAGEDDSDYLEINGDTVVNGDKKEIKFNRSFNAWVANYPYFVLYDAETGGKLLAWGELTTPIVVSGADVVPLFEEGKFQLSFPAPGAVEDMVDSAAGTES